MFVYGEEGPVSSRLSNHEWHNQLAEQIVKSFSGGEPALFRVDLRLRPEGSAGPLARSLESMENYYAGVGGNWGRLALIKTRGIGGRSGVGLGFFPPQQPFLFPQNGSVAFVGGNADNKRR